MTDAIDVDGTGSGYSGTFRWKRAKVLPRVSSVSGELKSIDVSAGWRHYFESRFKSHEDCRRLMAAAKTDLSMIDCLSFPLSILVGLEQMSFFEHMQVQKRDFADESLHFVCIGTSDKAEERVLLESDCFDELFFALKERCPEVCIDRIHLYLVGPEMSGSYDHSDNVHVHKSSALNFFRDRTQLLSELCVVIGFNCGFGNFANPLPRRYDLLLDWLADLYFLTGTQLPLVFTCANDHEDVAGESQVMQKLMGAQYLIPPFENPVGFASTFISSEGETNYSRGNSFIYAVQGSIRERRKALNLSKRKSDKQSIIAEIAHVFKTVKTIPFSKLCIELHLPKRTNYAPNIPQVEMKALQLDLSPPPETVFGHLTNSVADIPTAHLTPPTCLPSVQDASSDDEDETGRTTLYKNVLSNFNIEACQQRNSPEDMSSSDFVTEQVGLNSSNFSEQTKRCKDPEMVAPDIVIENSITEFPIHASAEYDKRQEELKVVLSGITAGLIHMQSIDVQASEICIVVSVGMKGEKVCITAQGLRFQKSSMSAKFHKATQCLTVRCVATRLLPTSTV